MKRDVIGYNVTDYILANFGIDVKSFLSEIELNGLMVVIIGLLIGLLIRDQYLAIGRLARVFSHGG